MPDCPHCLAIKWAQWLIMCQHYEPEVGHPESLAVIIPLADWEAVKELAEEPIGEH